MKVVLEMDTFPDIVNRVAKLERLAIFHRTLFVAYTVILVGALCACITFL